ncbi:unnamed protein product [Symbiodinium microadriaticum]|nr:unnamed protein product [Symbiodinium sp. KB8]CAE7239934.1 unnamed protein product [Symbiodinium microadriaticum]
MTTVYKAHLALIEKYKAVLQDKRIISIHPGGLDPLLALSCSGWPLCLQPGVPCTSLLEQRARYYVEVTNQFFCQREIEATWNIDPAASVPNGSVIFFTGKITVDLVKTLAERYDGVQLHLVCMSRSFQWNVGEVLKMASFKQYFSEGVWMLPPGAGEFNLRVFCASQDQACALRDRLADTTRDITAHLRESRSMKHHLLNKHDLSVFSSGESFRSHGDGSGKRKFVDDEEDTEADKAKDAVKSMLLACAEKGIVPKDLDTKILGKCMSKFQDHGKACVVNAYILHHQLGRNFGADMPVFAGAARPLSSFDDIAIDAIPRSFQGVVLVAIHDKKKKLRTVLVQEVLSCKGWQHKSYGLSLIGPPRRQFEALSILPPSYTVLAGVVAACAV